VSPALTGRHYTGRARRSKALPRIAACGGVASAATPPS
jgi:hypothetical protein